MEKTKFKKFCLIRKAIYIKELSRLHILQTKAFSILRPLRHPLNSFALS